MKQTIRINESQLREMITESVKRTLNELDWKTYANAAKKSRERASNAERAGDITAYAKHSDRQRAFDRATEKELNRKHGGRYGVNSDDEHIQRFHSYPDNPFSTSYDYAHRPMDGYEEDWNAYADTCLHIPGSDEISDFVNGRYDYDNNKGWHLKDNQ